ncbi:hypothetical protein [Roseovarius sp. 2305UL8-3]|uniref:hypothetical protein n=1 Tax=Roseovarius conchicola TaxID=3121636 RepID=UPI003527BD18
MTQQIRLGRITETTIRNALLYMRAECLRDGVEGVDHVDALLRLRGHDPEAFGFADKRPKAFRKGELRQMVLDALRDGPQTGAEIACRVQARKQVLTYKQAYRRVYGCLEQLQRRGLVVHEGRVWQAHSLALLSNL